MNWQEVTLKDVSSHVDYGYTASAASQAVGPKFLRITDIVPELVDWEAVPYCEIEGKKLDKYQLEDGDIVVARTGATTGYAKCLRHPPVSVFASYLVRFRLSDQVNKRFVGHVIQSQTYKDFIKRNVGGAAQPNANAQVLGSFPFKLPPLPTQQRIAEILSAYDDLIENNTRRIGILEEMARRLYEEWFVHFRFPGHEAAEFEPWQLGEKPSNWPVAPFTELAEVLSGGTPKKSEPTYWEGTISFFTPRDAPTSAYSIVTENRITELGLQKCNSRLYPKDTVFITARGTVGRVALASRSMAMNQSCYALMAQEGFGQLFLFSAVRDAARQLKGRSHGAVFDTIIVDTFRQFLLPLPDRSLAQSYEERVRPMFDQLLLLERKNANLRAQRDLLLPKLVSGEIDVSGAEAKLEAAE